MHATDSLVPSAPDVAVIDAELRAQRRVSLAQWAAARAVPYALIAALLEGRALDPGGVLDELASDLGVSTDCLR